MGSQEGGSDSLEGNMGPFYSPFPLFLVTNSGAAATSALSPWHLGQPEDGLWASC